ncbi:MAG: tyrosine-type recombinase/integrase, partial [Acidimicrobiales bacterium]
MPWKQDDFVRSLVSASPNTVAAYRHDVVEFTAWVERTGIAEPAGVTPLTLRRYLAYLSTRRYARRTIARKAAALRRYFDWLRRRGVIATDPARRLSAPKGESRLPRILKGQELAILLGDLPPAGAESRAQVDSKGPDGVDLRDRAVVELLYGSGLRVAELCSLRTGDVDVRTGRLLVWGKGAKQRQMPMSQPSVEAVQAWLRGGRAELATPESPPDVLFLNRRGRPLTPRDVRRILDRRAPVPTHPHALRHTFATHHVRKGTKLDVVRQALGHESLATTSVYVGLAREVMD